MHLVCPELLVSVIMTSMIRVTTHSIDGTKALATAIGEVLRGGETIELISDVGGGKTTFVKGLALGLGIDEVIQSPTFTISRLYNARDGLELHHFDFYRLSEAGIVAAELAESLAQNNAIVAVEWGDIVHDVLPRTRLVITITSIGETDRQLSFAVPAQYHYIADILTTFTHQQKIA